MRAIATGTSSIPAHRISGDLPRLKPANLSAAQRFRLTGCRGLAGGVSVFAHGVILSRMELGYLIRCRVQLTRWANRNPARRTERTGGDPCPQIDPVHSHLGR